MSRDFTAEMRALMDQMTNDDQPYISRQVAEQIVKKLTATDPELLDGWLHLGAETFVWRAINDRDRSVRAAANASAKATLFAADARSSDPERITRWLEVPYVVADGTRKTLAHLTGSDLNFVAEGYEASAQQSAMTASFMRALARKVKTQQVSDFFTDADLTALWVSINR